MTLSFIDKSKGRHYVIDTDKLEIKDVENCDIVIKDFIMTVIENGT